MQEESSSRSWSQSMSGHHDPMVSAPEDDFANFLDLADFQLNFPPFESAGQHATAQQDGSHAMDMSFDGGGEGRGDGGVAAKESYMHQQRQQQQQDLNDHQIHSTVPMRHMDQTSAGVVLGLNAQINYLQRQQQDYQQQSVIPLTPNSVEMHAGTGARYYQQIDPQSLAFLERYHQRLKEDQMVFTPLVSPAVTPLDTNFAIPEYTVPGAYFSPLTSPALEAQNHAHRVSYPNLNHYDGAIATSPDMSIDLPTAAVPSNTSPAPPRKPRRKMSATTRKPPARVVQQSPSMKPQTRRKAPPNSLNSTKGFKDAIEEPPPAGEGSTSPRRTPGSHPAPYQQDSSEGGSISPEPLSEALMAPPPPPGPAPVGRSQSGQNRNSEGLTQTEENSELAPATPASLMKLSNPPMQNPTDEAQNGQDFPRGSVVECMADDSGGPASVKPSLSHLDTRSVDSQSTPTLSSISRTPIAKAMSTPSTRDHSPQQAIATTPNGTASAKIADTQTNSRSSKKRSGGSVQVSPALRPKISPSIKPLLPEGFNLKCLLKRLLYFLPPSQIIKIL
ncbi:hypothetical protein FGG08_004734 [Glutinoglossum americanum]|uniref:Uncharacterized protein n=1 Tax=Glutinoglossum americanum TaxID=1670608 RepID=A0A9P8I8J6_9PEZI|nr:hypothetical protein FGG08_004734 [Glutinoglossum americanum]